MLDARLAVIGLVDQHAQRDVKSGADGVSGHLDGEQRVADGTARPSTCWSTILRLLPDPVPAALSHSAGTRLDPGPDLRRVAALGERLIDVRLKRP